MLIKTQVGTYKYGCRYSQNSPSAILEPSIHNGGRRTFWCHLDSTTNGVNLGL